jgi:glutathione peroxidase
MNDHFQCTPACEETLAGPLPSSSPDEETQTVLHGKMKSLAGQEVDLTRYRGQVLLVVNVASECGYTPQYRGLQALYDKYGQGAFMVLGFPCNQFGRQEPGTSEQIARFCQKNYGVTFDMFEKVDVNGKNQCDLYRYLTSPDTNAKYAGPIQWNFEKFLVARDGTVVGRFGSGVAPESKALVEALERELKQPA